MEDDQQLDQVAEPTAEEIAEDQAWDDAASEVFGDDKPQEKKDDEQTKPEEGAEAEGAGEKAAGDKASDGEQGNGDDAKGEGAEDAGKDDGKDAGDEAEAEDGQSEADAIAARVAARASVQEVETVKNDIREKMFSAVPTELKDSSGDPIKTVADVMGLVNPDTGEGFTREEAEAWLTAAQTQLRNTVADMNAQIDQITEVNVALKDESDLINLRYGELLKEMPDLAKELWDVYAQSLVTDPKTGIITKAPRSLEKFYETALQPYVRLAEQLEEQAKDKAAADAEAQTKQDTESKERRQAQRADRSDIFTGGKKADQSPEDKEWADAAQAVFGNQLG